MSELIQKVCYVFSITKYFMILLHVAPSGEMGDKTLEEQLE